MNTESVLLLAAFLLVLLALAWPTGRWVAAVAEGRSPGWLRPVRSIETAFTGSPAWIPSARWAGAGTRWRCCLQRAGPAVPSTRCSGCSAAAAEPAGARRRVAPTRRSTRR